MLQCYLTPKLLAYLFVLHVCTCWYFWLAGLLNLRYKEGPIYTWQYVLETRKKQLNCTQILKINALQTFTSLNLISNTSFYVCCP